MGASKLHSESPAEDFMQMLFLRKNHFFRGISGKYSPFWQTLFVGIFKTINHGQRNSMRPKKVYIVKIFPPFSNLEQNVVHFLSKSFRQGCHNCNLHNQWSICSERTSDEKLMFFHHLLTLSRNSLDFCWASFGMDFKTAFFLGERATWGRKF